MIAGPLCERCCWVAGEFDEVVGGLFGVVDHVLPCGDHARRGRPIGVVPDQLGDCCIAVERFQTESSTDCRADGVYLLFAGQCLGSGDRVDGVDGCWLGQSNDGGLGEISLVYQGTGDSSERGSYDAFGLDVLGPLECVRCEPTATYEGGIGGSIGQQPFHATVGRENWPQFIVVAVQIGAARGQIHDMIDPPENVDDLLGGLVLAGRPEQEYGFDPAEGGRDRRRVRVITDRNLDPWKCGFGTADQHSDVVTMVQQLPGDLAASPTTGAGDQKHPLTLEGQVRLKSRADDQPVSSQRIRKVGDAAAAGHRFVEPPDPGGWLCRGRTGADFLHQHVEEVAMAPIRECSRVDEPPGHRKEPE